ncbi:MAG TPA: hypothetical protein VLX09_07935 [Stellaceae bacterium]|nr:hypothetical protein [Stellaceae bacterium]
MDMETFDDSEKLVVAFSDHPKLLALNKTNAKTIEAITGSEETNDWVGAQIVMFPTTTDYAGKRVACIRVRAPRTTPPAATLAAPKPAGPPPSDLDDEIPF